MRTVNHYSKRMLAILLTCVLCINLFLGTGFLQKAAAETAASGVDLMNSASFSGKTGVLSYDVDKKEGWVGGNGTTVSTDVPVRYFTYNTYGDVIVDGEEVALTSREITYSVTFSDFAYDAATYPSGVRQQAVILMLRAKDGDGNTWQLENRFGAQKYGSGHYMQLWKNSSASGTASVLQDVGAPFYSTTKNSIANFPALADGDTISMKVKCATETEDGYIKLLLNGEEKHSFVYTGTALPDFGLKAYKLMAKISNVSLTVDGATRWSQCITHTESERIVDVQPTAQQEGSWHTECTTCGQIINSGTIPALVGLELIDENACLSNQKVGVLTYDVSAKQGWVGGNGTTASTDVPERYFSFPIYKDVLVNDEAVPYDSCEITYSITFSNFTYDTTTYPSGVRQQAAILMLLVKDGDGNTWKLENRFGAKAYGSGHYMQIWKPGSTAGANSALQDVGAPFYSTTKNSIANFPALANGDTISMKVKCATETEDGYIKLLLNGEEMHSFVYTGTEHPDFGLKAYKLMAKTSNASVFIDGATGWAPCEHAPGEIVKENEKPADCVNPGSYDSVVNCIFCGEEVSRETIVTEALGHTYDDDQDADCNVCGATREVGPATDENLVFNGNPGLSFKDYIGMQILVSKALADGYDRVWIEAVQADPAGDVTTTLEGVVYYGVYLKFEQQVLSWSMAENITLTLWAEKDGETVKGEVFSASVEDLALAKIADYAAASNTKAVAALVDMLNYGAAVQTSFDHNADMLPNTKLGDYTGTTATPEFNATNEITGTGTLSVASNSISMQAKVEIQLLIMGGISDYTVNATVGGAAAPVVVDTEKYAAYNWTLVKVAVAADKMRQTYTISINDANGTPVTQVYNVSVEAYGKTQLEGAKADVVIAMMRYGDSVAAL